MRNEGAPDAAVAAMAGRQHGVVSIDQLHQAGLSNAAVMRRARSGRLHRIHRGIYAVGHIAPSVERGWMAAVLALGDGAVLSHRSAAALWALLPPDDGPVHVSLRGRGGRRRREGICIHRPTALHSSEITRHRGIPVTSPARTLADLPRTAPEWEIRRATRQADFLGLPTGPAVESDGTRSELERRFLRLCHQHRLPRPAVNLRIGSLTVDFCWVREKLIVETDGYRSHRGKAAFEDDRARDLLLRAQGYEVLRLSHRQVFGESTQIAAVLQAILRPPGHVSDAMRK